MTLQEIAGQLGVTDSALRHAIRRKELHATKAGTTWVVEDAEVARYKEARRPPGYPKGRPRRRPADQPAE